MKMKPDNWSFFWWCIKHPFYWGGNKPAPFVWVGPFLITWSRWETRPWWLSIRVSFLPD